jgi:hypothetical protein
MQPDRYMSAGRRSVNWLEKSAENPKDTARERISEIRKTPQKPALARGL